MTKILVIEDDNSLQEVLAYNLRRESYTPLIAPDPAAALAMARLEDPDLILLDVMLPGASGFDVCREIRAFSAAPIIMLTARGEQLDRVLGLEMGADDYVTKPFQFRELLARIRANLRRVAIDLARQQEPRELSYQQLSVNVERRVVEVAGRPVTLQPKEFDLLVYFMRNPTVVLTRDRILAQVWGHEYVGERTVDVHVRRVRAKLEALGSTDAIATVHGVGYVFGRPMQGSYGAH